MKRLILVVAVAGAQLLPGVSHAGYWDGYAQGARAGQQIGDNLLDAPVRRQNMQLEIRRQQIENERLELELHERQEQIEERKRLRQERIDSAVPETPQ